MSDLPSSAPAGSPPPNAACPHGIEGLCFACLPVRRRSFDERAKALYDAIRAAHKAGVSPDSIAALTQIREGLYAHRQEGHEKTALKNRIRNYRRAIKQLQKAYDLRESLIGLSISRAARRHEDRLNSARESQELRYQLSALREENERLNAQLKRIAPDWGSQEVLRDQIAAANALAELSDLLHVDYDEYAEIVSAVRARLALSGGAHG